MKVELRNISHNVRLSEETECFSADIWIDDKKAGQASNRGHGGPTDIHFDDKAIEAAFTAYCKTLPPVKSNWEGIPDFPMTTELFVDELLAATLLTKKLQKWCKTKTVFRLKTTARGAYVTINQKWDAAMEAELTKKYGDQIEEIINRRFEASSPAAPPAAPPKKTARKKVAR